MESSGDRCIDSSHLGLFVSHMARGIGMIVGLLCRDSIGVING